MNIFVICILGILVGWLIECVIEFVCWRRGAALMQSKFAPVPVSGTTRVRQVQPVVRAALHRDDS